MHLIVQGADVETSALKELAKLSGARQIEQIAPNVFRLKDAVRTDGIAELCAQQKLDWRLATDD